MPGDINNLDPMEDFESFLRATHFNKGQATQGEDADDGAKAKKTRMRWNAYKSGDLEVTIVNGDVEFGGKVKTNNFPVIEWDDITIESGIDADGVLTIPTGNTEWYVWVEVDMRHPNEVVTLRNAATVEQLSDVESETRWIGHTLQKRIAAITIADDVITAVAGDYQCGNIFIPRTA